MRRHRLLSLLAAAAFAAGSVSKVAAQPEPSPEQAASDPSAVAQPPANLSTTDEERQADTLLRSFGVEPTAEATVARFLEDGIPEGVRLRGLPLQPRRRLELFVPAMELVATRGYSTCRAGLMRLLQGDYSVGVKRVIEDDAAFVASSQRDAFLRQVDQLLQYNAANALSMLGETAALPWIRRRYEMESTAGAKIRYALSGATLGDSFYLEPLTGWTEDPDPVVAYSAFQALEKATGERYGVAPFTPIAARREAAVRARRWMSAKGKNFKLEHELVAQRRRQPDVHRPPLAIPPANVREHLLWSRVFVDGGEAAAQARASRRFLGEMSPDQARQALEPLLFDVREDLDVRLEAMVWHARALGDNATDAMKKLAGDENPPVRTQAQAYLERNE